MRVYPRSGTITPIEDRNLLVKGVSEFAFDIQVGDNAIGGGYTVPANRRAIITSASILYSIETSQLSVKELQAYLDINIDGGTSYYVQLVNDKVQYKNETGGIYTNLNIPLAVDDVIKMFINTDLLSDEALCEYSITVNEFDS